MILNFITIMNISVLLAASGIFSFVVAAGEETNVGTDYMHNVLNRQRRESGYGHQSYHHESHYKPSNRHSKNVQ